MSEHIFQRKFIKDLKADGNLVENLTDEFNLGIPDLYIANPRHLIWAELKWCKIPKRLNTPFDLAHFTGPQKNFLRRHDTRPGMCFLVIGTPKGWFSVPPSLFTQLSLINNTLPDYLFHNKISFTKIIYSSKQLLDTIK